MNNNKKKEVLDFIIECSNDKTVMCDYFEIIKFLKTPIRDEDGSKSNELSIILNELKKENKIKPFVGEYLPKE